MSSSTATTTTASSFVEIAAENEGVLIGSGSGDGVVVGGGGDGGGGSGGDASSTVVKGSVGWMNRSEVRKRVYAGMTPGEKRAKHIITGKELSMEGRQWIWDYWNNYKAANVGLSMMGIVICLVSIVLSLSAKGAFIEGRTEHWSICDWTSKIRCSPLWISEYSYCFGLFDSSPSSTAGEDNDDISSSSSSSYLSYFSPEVLFNNLLQLPNDMYLMVFYVLQIVLSEKRGPKFVKCQLFLSTGALALAGRLAHAIVVVLDLWACPMAVLQFAVNSGLALTNVTRWRALKRLEQSKKA